MNSKRIFIHELVSVIVPVFKSENYIFHTISSILNQTYKAIEIIVVDDCSPDNSAKIVQELASLHKNITYFKQDTNRGAGAARNKALEIARGQYVAFLDADDSWKSEKIEKQVALLRKMGGAIGYTAIEMIDNEGGLVKSKRKVSETCTYRKLLRNTMLATSSVIIDRNQLGDFRMPLQRSGQDYATWLLLMRNGNIAYGINEPLVQYRIGLKNSLSAGKTKNYKKVISIQIEQEGISPIIAYFNAIQYIIRAVIKYYF